MTWTRDDCPGHGGALIGLVAIASGDPRSRFGDRFRELTELDAGPCYPDAVQVGCSCGWRSARLGREAPIDCCWWPARTLETSEWFAALGRAIWDSHAEGPGFADQAARFLRAGG